MANVDIASFVAVWFCLLVLVLGLALALDMSRRPAGERSRGRRGRPRQSEGPAEAATEADSPELDDEEPVAVEELPYTRRRDLLTQAERDFFAVLRAAAPEGWHVFPQVRLANLVMLKRGTRNWKPHYSRVAQKCVDFVLCDGAEIRPRLVVELDDASHDRPDRQARDRFVDAALDAAGLPILHVRWRRRYDAATLAAQIRDAAGLSPAPRQGPAATPAPAPAPMAARATVAAPAAPSEEATAAPQRWACRACNAEVGAATRFCKVCGAQLDR